MELQKFALMDSGQTYATRIGLQLITMCSVDSYLEETMSVGVYTFH